MIQKLLVLILVLGGASIAQAQTQTIDLSFTGLNFSATGSIEATDNGNGLFTATSGTLDFSLGSGPAFQLTLDPVPAGAGIVGLHDIANAGGASLFGDDQLGSNTISGFGLLFANPPINGNASAFNGDVLNVWGNGNGTFTLAYAGPDFPAGVSEVSAESFSIGATATPEPSSWALGIIALSFAVLLVRQRHAAA